MLKCLNGIKKWFQSLGKYEFSDKWEICQIKLNEGKIDGDKKERLGNE